MSAGAEALRVPGKGSHRAEWLALAAFLLAAVVTMALVMVTTNHAAPVPTVKQPAAEKVVPVSGDGVRVGGTSVYRYHPLPATNVVVGSAAVVKPAPAGGSTAGGSNASNSAHRSSTGTPGRAGGVQY